jgi:hypothetical protein
MGRFRTALVAVVLSIFVFTATAPPAFADTTVAPTAGAADNCWPFGVTPTGFWGPYFAYVYKDVPAFSLVAGTTGIGFDLGIPNDTDIQMQIDIAPATTNGGNVNATSFTTIVTNAQLAGEPAGNSVVGDFELTFGAVSNFTFSGGGLIIRFSDAGGAFATDGVCDGAAVNTSPADPSGFFVERPNRDVDGVAPWDDSEANDIAGFKIFSSSAKRIIDLKFSSSNKIYKGTVHSQNPDCTEHRIVELYKKITGPDILMDEALTNGGGNYAFLGKYGKGKFVAVAPVEAVPGAICAVATSNVVKRL